jgi:glycosyltransferase involved in cell wall biosynthesis
MKRLLSIARSHGAMAVLSRAAALARRNAMAAVVSLRNRAIEYRDAALWLPRLTPSFRKPSGPIALSILALGSRDKRKMASLLSMLAREVTALPSTEIFTIDEPSAKQIAERVAQAQGTYLYLVSADAIVHRGSIAALLEALERHPDAAACASQARPGGPGHVRPIESPEQASILWRRSAFGAEGKKTVLLQPRSRITLRTRSAARDPGLSREIAPCSETILVIDDHVPFEDRDAGSERMAQLLMLMQKRARVLFAGVERRSFGSYGERLEQNGIELICGLDERALRQLSGRPIHTIWLARPDVAAKFLLPLRKYFPGARIVYDTVDLHFLRLQRQQDATGMDTGWQRYRNVELSLAMASDATVATNADEAAILRESGVRDVHVVAMAAAGRKTDLPMHLRHGIIFFGNYAHEPNVDAAITLAREILPRVHRTLPGVRLTLAGSDPTPEVMRLAGGFVEVTGYVRDLDALISRHRVAVFPLRFGAGIKGKVLRAMACGIPVVTTSVGAEGIAQSGGATALAETPEEFVREIVSAYAEPSRWDDLSQRSTSGAQRFSLAALENQLDAALNRGTA